MYIATLHNGSESTEIHNEYEKLTSGKVVKGINTIDSFQFTMLPSNAGFEKVYDYVTLVSVYNTNRNRNDFLGRVLCSEDEMGEDGGIKKDVICENFFGFFCDSQQSYVKEQNWTVKGLFQHIVEVHNSQVEPYKRFTVGVVTVTDPNDNVYCGIQRENTWETIQDKLIGTLGGEICFRVESGTVYIDYLTEIGGTSETEIALSKNMKSIVREIDPSEIVTRLIPLGSKLKETVTDSNGNKSEVETEYRLDITSVNDGKNYIDDEDAIALYGIRVGTVEFDGVTVASNLLSKGEQWLAENNTLRVSHSITALDLSLIGLAVDDFDIGYYHPLKNHLLGINETVRVIKKSIDICEETKSTIDVGDKFWTMTDTMKKQAAAVKQVTTGNEVLSSEFGALDSTKVGRNEYEQIVLMVNSAGGVVAFNNNRLTINSTNFELAADGTITAKAGTVGGFTVGEKSLSHTGANGVIELTADDTPLLKITDGNLHFVSGGVEYSLYMDTATGTVKFKSV